MRVETVISGRSLDTTIRLDPDESLDAFGQMGRAIELVTDSARIELEHPVGDVHPDLIALTLLTFLAPWVRHRLTLDIPVSSDFAQAANTALGVSLEPIDPSLKPRQRGENFGLMYSGGPDCMAAQVLLDREMTLFHFRRVTHRWVPNRATGFKAGTQEALARRVERRGAELHVARSDLEYLCRPFPTFPHWAALTIGAVLDADRYDLGAVVSGRNISGIYLGWGRRFNAEGENEAGWEAMFAAAGLQLLHPLAGASDVLSKRIARSHPFHDLARSCVAGSLEAPCWSCKKCLVTELMNAAFEGQPMRADLVDRLSSSPKVTRPHSQPPYPAQHLLAYTLARVPGIESTFLGPVKEAIGADLQETSWLERYYRPALVERLPSAIAKKVHLNIQGLAEFMTPGDEALVRSWSAGR